MPTLVKFELGGFDALTQNDFILNTSYDMWKKKKNTSRHMTPVFVKEGGTLIFFDVVLFIYHI